MAVCAKHFCSYCISYIKLFHQKNDVAHIQFVSICRTVRYMLGAHFYIGSSVVTAFGRGPVFKAFKVLTDFTKSSSQAWCHLDARKGTIASTMAGSTHVLCLHGSRELISLCYDLGLSRSRSVKMMRRPGTYSMSMADVLLVLLGNHQLRKLGDLPAMVPVHQASTNGTNASR